MITPLSKAEADQLLNGICPKCGSGKFRKGPRGGLCVNVLCLNCRREYNVGCITAEIISEHCPDSRAQEFYGLKDFHGKLNNPLTNP